MERTKQSKFGNLSSMFAALPICAKTDTACILHGGIPKQDFSLHEIEVISSQARSKMSSLVQPQTAEEKLVQFILWSDPSDKDGISPNPRGCGIAFGPDIARDFLKRHNLKYLIRSHEPVEKGVMTVPCGDDRYVVTVFSAASYQGSNLGAILHVDKNGNCDQVEFKKGGVPSFSSLIESIQNQVGEIMSQGSKFLTSENETASDYEDTLRSFISDNRYQLERYFLSVENDGLITKAQWVAAMEEEMGLQNVPWVTLQHSLAPTLNGTDLIDWKEYLTRNTARKLGCNVDEMKILQDKNEKLLELFEFIDTDGSGEIGPEEFAAGINFLNEKHLPPDMQIKNVKELFETLDTDQSGEISIEEFSMVLNHSAALTSVVSSLSGDQLQVLQQNHAMLLAAFEFLDMDGNNSIDREEFRTGVELLNKRLPENARIKDCDELFSLIDLDDSGDISIQEFGRLLQSL